jgi:pentatricopeptide repeat protein
MVLRNDHKSIEDHGVIGDLYTVALVSTAAVVDFLCLPDFDSPSIFASILDSENGGYFSIAPSCGDCRSKQMYLPETNILTTRFLSEDAVAEVVDYMPIGESEDRHRLVRTVRGIRGNLDFRVECRPRFDYGRAPHRGQLIKSHVAEFRSESHLNGGLRLTASVSLVLESDDVVFNLLVTANEEVSFILECGESEPVTEDSIKKESDRLFLATTDFWHAWVAKSTYRGRWRETVARSALVLKLLTSRKHGSIIAAPTFGLPEGKGGVRNWDYRYTWIRDAAFTVYAFVRLGYIEETRQFMSWLKDRIDVDAGDGPLRVMYSIDGSPPPQEISLDHLEGYAKSAPVRVGNAASGQLQLDIFGELMDAVYLATKYGDAIPYDGWKRVCTLVDWVAKNWRVPDAGMWEIRSEPKQFLHSRVMCWVAVDRALRLAGKRSLPAPYAEWQSLRNEIHGSIYNGYWNEGLNSFVTFPGADFIDGAALLMPLVRFVSPVDPRWLGTLKKIEEELVEDALVFRYRNEASQFDGLDGIEGTFSACSFWYIECLARAHRIDEARLLFERMISYSNHLGLYAEELGPSGEHLGNFPQALTHLALISAATYLDRQLDGSHPSEWR